jgi:hypothetical protein
MDEWVIIRERLQAGEEVVVAMKGCETLKDFHCNVYQIPYPTDLSAKTVVLKGARAIQDGKALTDMYDHEGKKLLVGVYTSRFTLPKINNKSFGDYL